MNLYDINESIQIVLEDYTDPETGVISDEGFEKLEKLSLQKSEKMTNIARLIREWSSYMENIEKERERLANRHKMYSNKIDRLKDYVMRCMGEEKKYQTPDFTFSKRYYDSVEIIEENDIPAEYFVEKIQRKVDKKSIKEAIENGKQVTGATIVSNPSVVIS